MAKDFLSDVDFKSSVTLTSTDAGSAAAPELKLYRNSASPADADYIGQIKFQGENDNDQKVVYAKITGKIGDASDTTEDGIIEIAHQKAGSNNISARFTSDALKLINGTGLEVADGLLTLGSTAVTSTAAELNILDGVTATTAELNILDGVTSTAAELNLVDGITAGTVSASLAVIADSNKDVTGFRNVTLTGELDAATLDISGNADIDGTTNLDAVDIDGAVQIDGAVTVGVDDTGVDVKFFGATSGKYMLWDESADSLIVKDTVDAVNFKVNGGQGSDGQVLTSTGSGVAWEDTSGGASVTISDSAPGSPSAGNLWFESDTGKTFIYYGDGSSNQWVEVGGASSSAGGSDHHVQFNNEGSLGGSANFTFDGSAAVLKSTLTVGVDDTGHDVKFFGATSGKYFEWDESLDRVNLLGGLLVGANGTGQDAVFYSSATDSYAYWDNDYTTDGANGAMRYIGNSNITFAGSTSSSANRQIIFDQDYAIYADNTGPGSDSSRLWINGLDGAAMYIGPRSGSHTWNYIRIAASSIVLLGTVSKTAGSFDIAHPSKGGDWRLRHSFIEGPTADNIYRGTVTISGSSATIDLDAVSGMTDGTWLALNTNPWAMVASSGNAVTWALSGKTLTINGPDGAVCSWMVIGERKDQGIIDSPMTNSDGRLIVEYEDAEREACPDD